VFDGVFEMGAFGEGTWYYLDPNSHRVFSRLDVEGDNYAVDGISYRVNVPPPHKK